MHRVVRLISDYALCTSDVPGFFCATDVCRNRVDPVRGYLNVSCEMSVVRCVMYLFPIGSLSQLHYTSDNRHLAADISFSLSFVGGFAQKFSVGDPLARYARVSPSARGEPPPK